MIKIEDLKVGIRFKILSNHFPLCNELATITELQPDKIYNENSVVKFKTDSGHENFYYYSTIKDGSVIKLLDSCKEDLKIGDRVVVEEFLTCSTKEWKIKDDCHISRNCYVITDNEANDIHCTKDMLKSISESEKESSKTTAVSENSKSTIENLKISDEVINKDSESKYYNKKGKIISTCSTENNGKCFVVCFENAYDYHFSENSLMIASDLKEKPPIFEDLKVGQKVKIKLVDQKIKDFLIDSSAVDITNNKVGIVNRIEHDCAYITFDISRTFPKESLNTLWKFELVESSFAEESKAESSPKTKKSIASIVMIGLAAGLAAKALQESNITEKQIIKINHDKI